MTHKKFEHLIVDLNPTRDMDTWVLSVCVILCQRDLEMG
jgi:hypothetical protein